MEKIVKLTYDEFCVLKAHKYSSQIIKHYICKHLNCQLEEIDDFDFDYKLTFTVWLKNRNCYYCQYFDTQDCPLNSSSFYGELDNICCDKFKF